MSDINPLEFTLKSVTYTCTSDGLYKDGFGYDPHPEKYMPPKVSKKSGGNANTTNVEKKPSAWWKAQCAFRGLNQSGAIGDMQLRIKDAKAKMLPELKTAETQLNKEFKKLEKSAKDGKWAELKTVEQKARNDPKKFLNEAFPKGGSGRPANLDIVVVKIADRIALANAAEGLGLESVTVDAPWVGNKKPSPDRWLILGRTRDAVWNQMREIERGVERSKREAPVDKPASKGKAVATSNAKTATIEKASVKAKAGPLEKSKPNSKIKPTLEPKSTSNGLLKQVSQPQKLSESSEQKGAGTWDVRGIYAIKCHDIESEWPGRNKKDILTLQIHLENRRGKNQMVALFDFRVVTGIMRFEKPIPVPKNEQTSRPGKRKREPSYGIDADGDVNMEDYIPYTGEAEPDSAYTDKVFHLAVKDKPTVRRPTWRYRWRGEETGEGEIQLGSDSSVRTITFSNKGEELEGRFSCTYLRDCRFTGVKVGTVSREVDPEGEWEKRNEEAYSRASRGRWG